MSYLTLPRGMPNFNKVVISFWFRVPENSLRSAAATRTNRLAGILPLVVWGPDNLKGYIPISGNPSSGTPYYSTLVVMTGDCGLQFFEPQQAGQYSHSDWVPGPEVFIDPSFIGIECSIGDNGVLSTNLKAHIQMTEFGNGSNLFLAERTTVSDYLIAPDSTDECPLGTAILPSFAFDDCIEGSYLGDGKQVNTTYQDFSHVLIEGSGGESFDIGGTDNCRIQPDQWNHVLISLDLSKPISATGTVVTSTRTGCKHTDFAVSSAPGHLTTGCRAYLALNDKNLTGRDISGFNVPGSNNIASNNAYFAAGSINSGPFTDEFWGGTGFIETVNSSGSSAPIFHYTPKAIPAERYAFGIPATPTFEKNIFQVEMAEFQMFTGAALDTGVERHRRWFITSKGTPADPALIIMKTALAIGDPTTWEPGADILAPPLMPEPNAPIGKRELGRPVISLTRSNANWIQPINLGTIKSKDFQKVGKIKAFHPEPRVGR